MEILFLFIINRLYAVKSPLITRRSQVQILAPLPKYIRESQRCGSLSFCLRSGEGALITVLITSIFPFLHRRGDPSGRVVAGGGPGRSIANRRSHESRSRIVPSIVLRAIPVVMRDEHGTDTCRHRRHYRCIRAQVDPGS